MFLIEVRGDVNTALQLQFEERIITRLRSLNADFREAMLEYEQTVTPVIELFPLGAGPFAEDTDKIKQTRMLK